MRIAPDALHWAEQAIARLRAAFSPGKPAAAGDRGAAAGTSPPSAAPARTIASSPATPERATAPPAPPARTAPVAARTATMPAAPPPAGPLVRLQIAVQPGRTNLFVPQRPLPPRSPAAPGGNASACWQPRNWAGRVAGVALGEGMLYVGSGLAGLSPWRAPIEPALIDPRLPVAAAGAADHQGLQMSYWPSYSSIPAPCRAAYLAWLAGGRDNPAAYIGYVFLFFYGIERRVLADALRLPAARAEIPALLAEVGRLLRLYGANRSFHGYATAFLRAARIVHEGIRLDTLAPPIDAASGEAWLELKMGLGSCAAGGLPLPAEWALAWIVALPEVNHRRAARRCSEDFRHLFLLRYREKFAEGIRLRARKARLTANYVAASPTFGGPIPLALPDLPDLDLAAPPPPLRDLGLRVLEELSPYSRWIGKTGDGESPAALALLPRELTASHQGAAVKSFLGWVAEQIAGPGRGVVDLPALTACWPVRTAGRFTRGDAEALAALLESHGYGVEPDARHEGFSPSRVHQVAFFRPAAGREAATPETPAIGETDALLHLAAMLRNGGSPFLAHADRQLCGWFASRLAQSPQWIARLEARRLRFIANPPSSGEVRKRLERVGDADRAVLARTLTRLVAAEGHVEPAYLPQLTKIYDLLGVPGAQVYSDVHAILSSGAAADDPVTVVPAGETAGYAVPEPRAASLGPKLDTRRMQRALAETAQLDSMLTAIFEQTDSPDGAQPAAVDGYAILGLDAPHSALLRYLATRQEWSLQQLAQLTKVLGLLPEGALEVINEAAFAALGEAVLEGDGGEGIEVRTDLLENVLHG